MARIVPTTPESPAEDFFRALEIERTQALVGRDMPVIERLHAAGYQLVTPSGAVFSRERYVAAIAAEPFYASWDHGPMSVRVAPAMAVVRYRARLGFPSGRVVECWHLDTYELLQGKWQAVWSQATGIPPAGAAAPQSGS
jgi:hypothetical protein